MGICETVTCTIPTCESSQLLPGVMHNLTPLAKTHEVVFLDLYVAGNFSSISIGRFWALFLPNDSDAAAVFLESCALARPSPSLPARLDDRAIWNRAPDRDLITAALHQFIA